MGWLDGNENILIQAKYTQSFVHVICHQIPVSCGKNLVYLLFYSNIFLLTPEICEIFKIQFLKNRVLK